MRWLFPAKTFLVGEYVALQGGSALILTTAPCFSVSVEQGGNVSNLPINSPAYNWWNKYFWQNNYSLHWHDPYSGLGGMGASSAQFLGAYYAESYINKRIVAREELLADYLQVAWNGKGLKPSGYDVIAQMMGGCVHIESNKNIYKSYAWPFSDIAFILLHTGKKQATHLYLQNLAEMHDLDKLANIANIVCDSFIKKDSTTFISAINEYYLMLLELNLVACHTLSMVESLKASQDILAVKGCGALGADILLVIMKADKLDKTIIELGQKNYNVIATSKDIYSFLNSSCEFN